MKNVHKQALVRLFVLEKALDILQDLGNPHYQNIVRVARDEAEFLPTIQESDEEEVVSDEVADSNRMTSDIPSPVQEDHFSAFKL